VAFKQIQKQMTGMLGVNLQIFDYYGVIGNFVFNEPKPVIENAYTYEKNGILYCASATETPHGKANASTDSMYYIHTDHLGSYCALTNENKKVRQSNRFDPWGNNVGTANFALTARGFTGHEHYPQFKIINMNGRLYDPVIARFLSPDDYVQNPFFTQNYNRYSYALNNPLKYVDRTGHRYDEYDDCDDDRYDAYDDDHGDGPKTPDWFEKNYPEMYEISGSSSGSSNPDDREYDPYQDFERFDYYDDGHDEHFPYPSNPSSRKGGGAAAAGLAGTMYGGAASLTAHEAKVAGTMFKGIGVLKVGGNILGATGAIVSAINVGMKVYDGTVQTSDKVDLAASLVLVVVGIACPPLGVILGFGYGVYLFTPYSTTVNNWMNKK